MLSNITLNHQKETSFTKPLLTEGDCVYLYGDRSYTKTLIRPVERTYPLKWTVELDRGGYEALNVGHISVVESQPSNPSDSDIDVPPGSVPESTLAQLQREIIALKRKNAELKQENELIKKDLDQAKQIIRRAKNISPLMRISLKRVLRLAHDACMDVKRTVGGWILKMGSKARKFRRLTDIWDLLSLDDFKLSEIFPEDKLIAVELILPPKIRKKPSPPDKRTFPLMRPSDIIRNRTLVRVTSG